MQLAPLRRRLEAWARGLLDPGEELRAAGGATGRGPRSRDASAPDVPPEDPGPSVGTLLRETRERRGISLLEAERDTRISRRYLEALEGDRFETLPAPVYIRGFVRTYAGYLRLDPEEAVSLVPGNLPRPVGLEPLPGLRRGIEGRALPAVEPLWIAVGIVAVIAVGAALLFFSIGGGSGTDPGDGVSPNVTATATEDGTPGASTPASTETPASTPPTEEAGGPAPTVPPFDPGTMPDFVGVEQAVAEAVLIELDLIFVVIELPSAEQLAGRVVGQSPEAGSNIEAGTGVTLVVSSGPE